MVEKLKGKNVLVTGGAGFIGSHIVDKLVGIGARVTVLDNLYSGKVENIEHNLDSIRFIQKDLTDDAALAEALEGIEYVSHQAALRSVPQSVTRPMEYHQVNVTGTLKLFLTAKEKKVKRICFASSSSVYGERNSFPECEHELAKPISPYAATKLLDEHYAYLFSVLYGLEVVALRYFNVFGPRQSLDNEYAVVVPKFIVSLLRGENPPIYGDGDQERDFTFIDNVVEANILGLVQEGIGGEVFNIADGEPKSVNYLFKALKDIIKSDVTPTYLDIRAGDVRKTHAAIDKAQELLSWKPTITFLEGLERSTEWFKQLYSL